MKIPFLLITLFTLLSSVALSQVNVSDSQKTGYRCSVRNLADSKLLTSLEVVVDWHSLSADGKTVDLLVRSHSSSTVPVGGIQEVISAQVESITQIGSTGESLSITAIANEFKMGAGKASLKIRGFEKLGKAGAQASFVWSGTAQTETGPVQINMGNGKCARQPQLDSTWPSLN